LKKEEKRQRKKENERKPTKKPENKNKKSAGEPESYTKNQVKKIWQR